MEEQQYIIHCIRRNQDKTVEEIAEKLAVKPDRVRGICKKLNIVLITAKQRKMDFISKNYGKMTATDMANELKISSQTIYTLAKEMNIKLLRAEEVKSGVELEVQLAKKVLDNPEEYHEAQILLAESIRRENKHLFPGYERKQASK